MVIRLLEADFNEKNCTLYIESSLLLCPFGKIIVLGFITLTPPHTYPWILGQVYSTRNKFPPMAVDLYMRWSWMTKQWEI